jgi:uncharacterized protein
MGAANPLPREGWQIATRDVVTEVATASLLPDHFPILGPVPAADVVGRGRFIKLLQATWLGGHHVLLAGPRRIGKLSVIAKAVDELVDSRDALAVSVSFDDMTTLDKFCTTMFDRCTEQLGAGAGWLGRFRASSGQLNLSAKFRPLGPILELAADIAQEPSPEGRLEHVLRVPHRIAAHQRKRVIVVFDEFQDAGKVHQDFYGYLRDQMKLGGVSYAFLGSQPSMVRRLVERLTFWSCPWRPGSNGSIT